MTKKIARVGIIELDHKTLLDMLDLEGGKILGIYQDDEAYKPGSIKIKVEHKDMPKVIPGDHLSVVDLEYHYNVWRGYHRIRPSRKHKNL